MREILYRAKCPDSNKWVYGAYIPQWGEIATFDADGQDCTIPVDGDTVGQYTGLKDRNGKRIFEGDIVLKRTYHGKKPFPVSYCDGMFHCGFGGGSSTPSHGYTLADNQIEVIGNIYDNPELLEG